MAEDRPRPRPRLAAALAAGRAQAQRLRAGAPVTEVQSTRHHDEATDEFTQAEAAVQGGAPLWRREWAVTIARATERSARAAQDEALLARTQALLDNLRAQDEAEIAPERARLRAAGFEAEAVRAAIAARPVPERDGFVRRLLKVDQVPERVTVRPAGMVHYLPTPLDAALDLCRFVEPGDVFCDIGSGLGYVTMLVSLLTGAETRGVEYDPAYHEWAVARAEELGIERVLYAQGDARFADYDGVTVMYFYDTFRGGFLEEMVVRMRERADVGPLTVISRGQSNPILEAVPWLEEVTRTRSGLLVLRAETPAMA